jgi:hypothetical protein
MKMKWKDKGVCNVQFAGAEAGKGGKEKPGSNRKHA